MAKFTIGSGDPAYMVPGLYGNSRPVIQNLGPGTLYFDTNSVDPVGRGIQIPTGVAYELPAQLVEGAQEVWLAADEDDCDVRIVNVG